MVFFGRRLISLGMAALLAIVLTACNLTQFKTATAKVPELILPIPSGPSTFNYPLNTTLYSTYVFALIYEGLLGTNGVTLDLEPGLADAWEIAEDKLHIIFHLREGLKWSDGKPLTLDDVLFTFQDIYLNPGIDSGVKDILRIGVDLKLPTVRKLDDQRIEFTIPEPFAPFLRFVGGLPILPAHVLRESVKTKDDKGNLKFLSTWGLDTDPKEVVVNGPYVMESFTPSQRLILRKNPYYWRRGADSQPQPYIDRIVWQIIESTDSQFLRFRSRELDALEVPSESFQLVKQEERRGRYTLYNGGPEPSMFFVTFNLNKAKDSRGKPFVDPVKSRWFNTLAFRQAVAYALDRTTIQQNVFRGLAQPQNSSIYFQSPYNLSPEEGLKVYDYDPEKSRQLLLGAGFRYDDQNQLLDADGNRVEFTVLVKSEEKSRVDVMNRIREDLAKIGIKANPQVVIFNSVIQKLNQRDWECYVGKFGGGSPDPHSGFNIWFSRGESHQFNQGPKSGEPPIQGWEVSDWEKEIDRLYVTAAQEFDETKRKAIYAKFQQLAQEQLPFIYLVNELKFEAVRNHIQGIQYSPLAGALWNVYELKVSQR